MSINDLGYVLTMVAFLAAFYSFLASFMATSSGHSKALKNAVNWAHISAFAVCSSIFILLIQLYIDDFHNSYVAGHSNIALPLFYKLSALWAGQQGSLLFWSWIHFLCVILTISLYYKIQNGIWFRSLLNIFKKKKDQEKDDPRAYMDPLFPYVLTVLMGVGLFFTLINFFASNPFEVLNWTKADGSLSPFVPPDGNGLNPLLQHPAMVFHPPTLYLGFVGFTVPFAFAIAALWTKRLGNVWIKSIRKWTVTAWLFLTIGIVLGGAWAYVELGWGGYWAWDPVENASFLPWLTATAFVHSVIIQEKRGMLKVWNVSLILITFILVIFGTFITRSGLISSVHSFAASNVGPMFAVFLVGTILLAVYLVVTRLPYLKSDHKLDSIVSRESSFLFNNFVLLAMTFSILWGVLFPAISELATGQQITVGPGFFNSINVPLGLFLLFLTGVGPLLAWRQTSRDSLVKNVLIPSIPMILTMTTLALLRIGNIYFILTIGFSVFVIIGIIVEFYRGIRAGMIGHKLTALRAFVRLMKQKQRRYGGYIVHFGIVLMFVGFAGNVFNLEERMDLAVGESMEIGDFRLTVVNTHQGSEPNYTYIKTEVNVFENGRLVGTLNPEKRKYIKSEQPQTEVDIMFGLSRDLYLVLENLKTANARVDLHAYVKPLVTVIWIGGFIIIFGIIIAIFPTKVLRKKKDDQLQELIGKKISGKDTEGKLEGVRNFQFQELFEKKNSLLYNIKDLDDDWNMGKFGEEDFKRMRNEYLSGLADVLKEIDETEVVFNSDFISNKEDAGNFLEREVNRFKHTYYGTPLATSIPSGATEGSQGVSGPGISSSTVEMDQTTSALPERSANFCSQCGSKPASNDKFCSNCGNKLA